MKHYKDPATNTLYAYEADGSQDEFILPYLVAISDDEADAIREALARPATAEQVQAIRQVAYAREADPLFFKAQRGEATTGEWLAKIKEIKARYPMPATNQSVRGS